MLKLILTVLRDILWEIAMGLIQTRVTARHQIPEREE